MLILFVPLILQAEAYSSDKVPPTNLDIISTLIGQLTQKVFDTIEADSNYAVIIADDNNNAEWYWVFEEQVVKVC